MKITVIVPVYNAAHTLERCMKNLVAQSRPADEIIFVDNGSDDVSVSAMQAFIFEQPALNILLLHESKRGPGAARNRALQAATGDVIAFTDADASPREDWLERLEALYVAGDWDGIGGVSRFWDPRDINTQLQAIQTEIPREFAGKEITQKYQCLFGQILGTCNASYRKKVLDSIGGFDERLSVTGEDMDLTMRAVEKGFKLLSWHPDVVVWHVPRKSLWLYWKRIFEYRMILAALLKKHFDKEAIVHVPGMGVLRCRFIVPLMITKEFYLLMALFFGALVFYFFSGFYVVFLLAGAAGVARFAGRLSKRAQSLGLRIAWTSLPALIMADLVQKCFSECGRIYGSFKARTLFL